jgi:hypothetical protein
MAAEGRRLRPLASHGILPQVIEERRSSLPPAEGSGQLIDRSPGWQIIGHHTPRRVGTPNLAQAALHFA